MSESMAVTTNGVDPTDIHEKKNLNLQFIRNKTTKSLKKACK
jgi:hypothetical protein